MLYNKLTHRLVNVAPYTDEEGRLIEFVLQEIPTSDSQEEIDAENKRIESEIKAQVEERLIAFAAEKDIDGIGEAGALLASSNPTWRLEAETFVRLWDETWQAFYNNEPLPELVW